MGRSSFVVIHDARGIWATPRLVMIALTAVERFSRFAAHALTG
jgi:hypothetical protein